MKDKKALIEAALFVSPDPIGISHLKKIVGVSSDKEIERLLNEIKEELDVDNRGYELAITGEGYQFRVKNQFMDTVSSLTPHADLSDGMLRTLGIIAVKQPVEQSEIVKIQGNKAYDYIKRLEGKGLIKTQKFSRTKRIETTKEFERYFGKNLNEIMELLKNVVKDEQPGDNVSDQNSGEIQWEDMESEADS